MTQEQKFKWSIHCSECKRDIPSKRDRIEKWQGKTYYCRVCRKKETKPKADIEPKEKGTMCQFCYKRGKTTKVESKDGFWKDRFDRWLCKKCIKGVENDRNN